LPDSDFAHETQTYGFKYFLVHSISASRDKWSVYSRCLVATILVLSALTVSAGNLLHIGGEVFDPTSIPIEKQLRKAGPQLFIIQYYDSIASRDLRRLNRRGIQIAGYVPQDALLVRCSLQQATRLEQTRAIRKVIPYSAKWKVHKEAKSVTTAFVSLLVVTLSAEDWGRVTQSVRSIGGRVIKAGLNQSKALEIWLPANRIQELAELDEVLWLQKTPRLTDWAYSLQTQSDEPVMMAPAISYKELSGFESGTKLCGFEQVWQQGWTGFNEIITVADTGLDTGVEAVLNNDFANLHTAFTMGLFANSWADPVGHGTHICGTAMGRGLNSDGAIKGAAYEAALIVESLWSPLLGRISIHPELEKLYKYPYDAGSRIHSNSWGSDANYGEYDSLAFMTDEFLWHHPDMVILFAAGNTGADLDLNGVVDPGSITAPATAKSVIAVGASENQVSKGGFQNSLGEMVNGKKLWPVEPLRSDLLSNNPNGIVGFSARGPTKDGRIKPDVVAPGSNILSAKSHHPHATDLWGSFNANYVFSGGTSMAVPIVAGAAAIIRQYLSQSWGYDTPSGALIKAILLHTAEDLYPGQFGEGEFQEIPRKSPNSVEGFGRVNIADVIALNEDNAKVIDEKRGLTAGKSRNYSVQVKGAKSVKVTLTYYDYPALPSANMDLVNDLDLTVINPQGKSYGLEDRVNNTESIQLKKPVDGLYTIRVKGVNVPMPGDYGQRFAVVVSLK
jgi:serine protease AprX